MTASCKNEQTPELSNGSVDVKESQLSIILVNLWGPANADRCRSLVGRSPFLSAWHFAPVCERSKPYRSVFCDEEDRDEALATRLATHRVTKYVLLYSINVEFRM